MSHISVRPAFFADARAIAAIHVATWQCAYRGLIDQDYLDKLDIDERTAGWEKILQANEPGTHAWVAEADGVVAGWCTAGIARDETVDKKTTGELYGIYVSPTHIGHGAGSALMETALSTLKSDGYKKVVLWVLSTNERTKAWYEKKGFRWDGAKKSEDSHGVMLEELRYAREL